MEMDYLLHSSSRPIKSNHAAKIFLLTIYDQTKYNSSSSSSSSSQEKKFENQVAVQKYWTGCEQVLDIGCAWYLLDKSLQSETILICIFKNCSI
jgi:hypothetical protein